MNTLYSHGNKFTEAISTPESRSGKVKDKDLVQGLTLLSVAFNKTTIKKLIKLGFKRYASMDKVTLRKVNLADKDTVDSIYLIHFLNTDTEVEFVKKNEKLGKKLKDAKHKYLKEQGLVDLTVKDLLFPKGLVKKELDNVPKRLKKILEGKYPIKNKTSLYVGLPFFKVVVRKPIKIKATNNLLILSKEDTTTESISDTIFDL